jgi:hypothetical protein
MKGKSNVAAARCDRVTAVWLEGPLEAVDSLVGMGSKATHHAEERTPVQPPKEEASNDETTGGRRT